MTSLLLELVDTFFLHGGKGAEGSKKYYLFFPENIGFGQNIPGGFFFLLNQEIADTIGFLLNIFDCGIWKIVY